MRFLRIRTVNSQPSSELWNGSRFWFQIDFLQWANLELRFRFRLIIIIFSLHVFFKYFKGFRFRFGMVLDFFFIQQFRFQIFFLLIVIPAVLVPIGDEYRGQFEKRIAIVVPVWQREINHIAEFPLAVQTHQLLISVLLPALASSFQSITMHVHLSILQTMLMMYFVQRISS